MKNNISDRVYMADEKKRNDPFSCGKKPGPYIFIHINKNGGCSIETAMGIKTSHETASDIVRRAGRDEWNKRFSFTFIRNPWDRVLSQYLYRYKNNKTGIAEKRISFSDWIYLTYRNKDPEYLVNPRLFIQQIDWITSDENEIMVDFIGRFENLAEDFLKVCRFLGHSFNLPHINKTEHKHYKTYYTKETRKIISEVFREDIRLFKYKF